MPLAHVPAPRIRQRLGRQAIERVASEGEHPPLWVDEHRAIGVRVVAAGLQRSFGTVAALECRWRVRASSPPGIGG